jgi:NADH-quinone oxidoreductase subunit A
MEHLVPAILPIFLTVICVIGLAVGLLIFARIVRPGRPGRVTRMPYESGMDPIHDTRRRFDVRFYLLAIAFLVFDVELLFLYPWAVVAGEQCGIRTSTQEMGTSVPIQRRGEGERGRHGDVARVDDFASPRLPVSPSTRLHSSATTENRHLIFAAVMIFVALLTLGFVYDWRKGVFQWR